MWGVGADLKVKAYAYSLSRALRSQNRPRARRRSFRGPQGLLAFVVLLQHCSTQRSTHWLSKHHSMSADGAAMLHMLFVSPTLLLVAFSEGDDSSSS